VQGDEHCTLAYYKQECKSICNRPRARPAACACGAGLLALADGLAAHVNGGGRADADDGTAEGRTESVDSV
jgi:hypothetical protein